MSHLSILKEVLEVVPILDALPPGRHQLALCNLNLVKNVGRRDNMATMVHIVAVLENYSATIWLLEEKQ